MRAVIQRVSKSSVKVDSKVVGSIQEGLLILVGVTHDDTEQDAKYLAEKIANLRIFEDEEGKLNYSVVDKNYKILSISQFTLYGDCRKGRRPNFMDAGRPIQAEQIYNKFNEFLSQNELNVEKGVFGAHMEVELVNDGPVTIMLDSKKLF
ncbi:D-tyrosyl-tRNA(Tyr) deacylase [Desulfonispora thiosulfatigenes DSM 11270]|uniref:D-aminoacyl-tRNA deacylase n=1 Tax=Desulfonispora thiosulfatigenes DSM 11270 TaxID=656914 RepID=A0A1W1VQP8_DESTI|nr:D-aminoacyl-tRNA deacylase [Desulfonispora thiosulfatigenes]SMB95678.1 D-tyrosyl-tRNA(Tyr) deacylase [Desulfonispora thiosulfatigenes DSM 11270]